MCRSCGEIVKCPKCDISLQYSKKNNVLMCPACSYKVPMITKCNLCHNEAFRFEGSGTEQLIEDINEVLNTYFNEYYNEADDKDTWFNNMKEMAEKLGYCTNMKEYKENPDNYKGSIADVSNIIRVGVTTKSQTPDLYIILKLLGKDRIKNRINSL